MSRLPPVTLTIYPYECDAFGHLNEAGYLLLFERARWETIARGPGMQFFRKQGVWPAVRHATVDYRLPAFPGDVVDIHTDLVKLGTTSMELRQRMERPADNTVLAEAHLVFVMIDGTGNPTAVPDDLQALFGSRVSTRSGEVVRYDVGDVTLGVDVRGDGPAVLFIHGFPLDRTIWKHQVSTLSGWRRIAPDLRGLGSSDVARTYSMAAYADDMVRLLDRLRIQKAVVAGLSMGGYVAFEMWRRYRDRISGLMLCDTRADADTADGKRRREEMIRLVESKGSAAVADQMISRVLGRTTLQINAPLVQQVRDMMNKASPEGIAGALRAMRDREDSTALLGTIDVPTLVVVGSEDELTPPAVAKAMTAAIPGATMTTIPTAGHITPLESATAVSRVFAEFLESVTAA